jgi:hypothetical protein
MESINDLNFAAVIAVPAVTVVFAAGADTLGPVRFSFAI